MKIILRITKTGDPIIRVEGVQGPVCEQKTARLEAALGVRQTQVKAPAYDEAPAEVGAGEDSQTTA